MSNGETFSTNQTGGSYRCRFTFNDPLQIRLFDFLSQLEPKERHKVMIFAFNLVARSVNYTVPPDGIMGIMTQMALGNMGAMPQPITPIEDLKAKYKTKGKAITKKKTVKAVETEEKTETKSILDYADELNKISDSVTAMETVNATDEDDEDDTLADLIHSSLKSVL